ncbi:MAG: class I tRNA ligase family protein, partial [SAR202 cluster bacterium]|nr:class I tRNA ligase family protein [SAR202 cluster bacterium]
MKLYNTLTGNLEEFTAPNDEVRMYVCGITPYAASHIGHAMSAVVFDIVRRYLEFRGFKVRHVQNFTDVDDKMINTAIELDVRVLDLAEPNIQDYLDEMDALNIERAHIYPRATAEIDAIVEIIEKLVDKGHAYAVDGDVYFRVRNDDDYGKLSHRDL